MRGRLLKLAYQLRYHAMGSWSLQRWLISLLLGAAIVLALWRLPAAMSGSGPDVWWPPALLVVLALLAGIFARWAAGQDYLTFAAETAAAPPGRALQPVDKILIHATGQFEVEGKSHFFAHLLAYWRTFASREHAVMAIVHPARFLLVGRMPAGDVGMWYIFWCSEKMVEVMPGTVAFGGARQPGLRVRYDTPELSDAQRRQRPFWQRRRRVSRRVTVYLAFDDDATREQVWADLLADAQAIASAT